MNAWSHQDALDKGFRKRTDTEINKSDLGTAVHQAVCAQSSWGKKRDELS